MAKLVTKILFLPFSVGSGLLAGLVGKKTFDAVWAKIDDRKPPRPDQREADFKRLALALALEGAVLRATRGLIDHSSRRGFEWFAGVWPGGKGKD